ncbi:MAG: hybrid sensor histidine kinase/response regulator [Dehalococcoidia bacterium]
MDLSPSGPDTGSGCLWRFALTTVSGSILADIELSRALAGLRTASGADLALAYGARGGQAITCLAVDADPSGRWIQAAAALAGSQIRPDQKLANARRQHRTLILPAADLPATSQKGTHFAGLDLPPWAAVLPLAPGRAMEGLLILLASRPRSDADTAALTAHASRVATEVGRVLLSHAGRPAEATPAPANAAPEPLPAAPRRDEKPARQPRSESPSELAGESLNLLLSVLREGLVVTDARGAVVAANEAGRELLEALQPGEAGHIVHPTLASTHRGVVADREPEELEIAIESEPRRYLRISAAAAPVANRVLLTLRDITEERLIHERLLQSEKMASIGQLVSGVAHELNNPLTGIMGFAQLLLMRDLPDQARREITTIHEEAERASRIVQNLLSFARRRRPEKERVDVNTLVERVFDLRGYDLRVHNIEPRIRLRPDLRPVLADPHQIQQVLLNIIRNAEHAIQERGGQGSITCTTSEDAEWVRIAIGDDGAGIAPEHVRRVFDPFFTTKQVGEGTGLGLTISYGIIEEHGGLISVDSQRGKGTTVKIQLPAAPGSLKPSTPPPPRAGRKLPTRRSILVIDDEPSIRQLLVAALSDDGHAVEAVGDATSGLELLAARDFDLIITDVKMPGIDGIEFYRRVQAWDAKVASRIIFTTGDTVSPTTRDFLESAGNPYLPKPFRIADLKSLVTMMLPR